MAIADFFALLLLPWAGLTSDLYQNYVMGAFYCKFEGFAKGKSTNGRRCLGNPTHAAA